MSSIKDLSPALVWKHFYQLTQCPRPSNKEEKVIDYIKNFCELQQFEFLQDEVGNVLIRKPATPGCEERPAVVLQGHLDMVCQKNSATDHDFENDPIETVIDGDWVKANGTTLGADNGIGVAAALAAMESDISHGPLEALFTIDEETGMTGAGKLDGSMVTAEMLINLDTECEGQMYVGCAGGINITAQLGYSTEKPADDEQYVGLQLSVTGLFGGHSGLDINKGRGNANKITNRILRELIIEGAMPVYVANLDGGSLRNAIPREAFTRLLVPITLLDEVHKQVQVVGEQIQTELDAIEKDLKITLTEIDKPAEYIDPEKIRLLILAVDSCPHGAVRMNDSVPDMPETSNNLARVKSEDGKLTVECMARSFIDSARDDIAATIASAFIMAGAEVRRHGAYPGWKPDMDSKILAYSIQSYEALFGVKPTIEVIHAGLECGLIGDACPGLDVVSFGPTIEHAHSPDEQVHIESVQRFWDLLVHVLENIPAR